MDQRPGRVVGVVLVGGTSSRMGSDKATLEVGTDGRRLVDVVTSVVAKVVDRVIVVGRSDAARVVPKNENGDVLVVEHIDDAGDGPLQALTAFFAPPAGALSDVDCDGALSKAWDTLAIVPVDMPDLTPSALKLLVDRATTTESSGAAFASESETLSLPVVVNRRAFPQLQTVIAAGERKLAKTLATIHLDTVTLGTPNDASVLTNLNSPEDVSRWQRAKQQTKTRQSVDDDRVRSTEVVRLNATGDKRVETDVVAEEEPLEIRVQGVSVAITMRTPGHDLELVRGFLVTEGVVESANDIVRVAHCERVEDPEAEDNIVDVTLAPGVDLDLERLRRNTFASSSCGICGKATLESALAQAGPVDDTRTMTREQVASLPNKLRAAQEVFEATGGLHAAGVLLDPHAKTLEVVREDVGRHNAIDKVVGHLGVTPATGDAEAHGAVALVVSGRVSFEVVQKSGRARWPIIVAISAPTSLAVRLATTLNITLIGFVRNGAMNIYSHPWRITDG